LKRLLPALLLAACSATRLTHARGGWSSCRAADPNLVECGGKQVAQVECFQPGEEACGALAVRYEDGERVFLAGPPGFEPGQEEAIASATVLRPELASDGSMIWFKPAKRRDEYWTVFETQTGVKREVDAYQIFRMRERDPHSMPLWVARPPTPQ
jgi:hypothetical protein